MPKIHGTRKQRAAELLERVKNGPSFSEPVWKGVPFTALEASIQYRRWAESWIVPELQELVAELKKKTVKP